jgi:xanthine dehydrogenase YagR molybdenum-binding subunit
MFGPVGARPQTYQHLTLGAGRDGKLTAIRHEVLAHTSYIEDYLESSAFPTRVMYACPNVSTMHRLVQLNLGTPTYARAPGVATGTYAIEVAMDELAYALRMDPVALRQANYAEVDPHSKLPFTAKHLDECYSRGAERFGWSKRSPEPGSMREEGSGLRIGWGLATETYPANRRPASALVRMKPDGRVLVASGTHEIGGGTYSILTQVAAETLGISPDRIDVQLGDTLLPDAPISAGSMTTASVAPAVQAAATQLKAKLQARNAGSDSNPSEVIEAVAKVGPDETLKQKASSHSFGAVFAEVAVDPELGTVKVRRIVAVYDVGKVLNEQTGRSQFIGGIIWGISLALHENTLVDARTGRVANGNLSEYHVPVNADIGEIDVSALNIPDTVFNSVGVRGIGEIGITGTAAAISNAVFHATGIRVRDLPITLDKLHSLTNGR